MNLVFKILAWIAGGLFALAIIVVGGFWLFLSYTADKMCGNQILSSARLPEANVNVVVFERDCGATTGFSTQVSLIKEGEKLPNEPGNIFVADTNHGKAPSGEGGGPELQIEVISRNRIRILHHQDVRVFDKQNQWNGIYIEYENL